MGEIIRNLPDVEYFKAEGINNTTLGHMLPTPAHCKAYMETPDERTPAMEFGAALHSAVLEPDLFEKNYCIEPNLKKPTKAQIGAKNPSPATVELLEAWQEWEAENEGLIPVSHDDQAKILLMRESIFNNKAAASVLTKGDKELTLYWVDEETGEKMKCRVDNYFNGYVIDLKTTVDASPAGFAKAVANYKYHRQAALYSDGILNCFGEQPKGFIFVAAEKEEPFLAAPYVLSSDSFARGHDEYRSLLLDFVQCKKTGVWQGYEEKVNEISLPGWYK